MLSTSFNIIHEQINLRIFTRLDHLVLQDGYHLAVHSDLGLTENTDLGIADNKYCYNPVLVGILTFFYCSDPSDGHASGRLSCCNI